MLELKFSVVSSISHYVLSETEIGLATRGWFDAIKNRAATTQATRGWFDAIKNRAATAQATAPVQTNAQSTRTTELESRAVSSKTFATQVTEIDKAMNTACNAFLESPLEGHVSHLPVSCSACLSHSALHREVHRHRQMQMQMHQCSQMQTHRHMQHRCSHLCVCSCHTNLWPASWPTKVWRSDIGIVLMSSVLACWQLQMPRPLHGYRRPFCICCWQGQ